MSGFISRLRESSLKNDSLLCVGLDVDPDRIPEALRGHADWVYEFGKGIIEATSDLVCAYKPNLAFYEALGQTGLEALARIVKAVPPDIPVIGDAKRGDVGHTAQMYARALFDGYGFDAVTVNPYLGLDTVAPFLEYRDRGIFILCKTSNPGSGDFQDLRCETADGAYPLYQVVARKAVGLAASGSVGLVVGATYPQELANIRQIAPGLPLLIPGIGAQSGDIEKTVLFGTDAQGQMAVINSSRQIIYASPGPDWREAARLAAANLRDSMNVFRTAKRGSTVERSRE